MCGRFTITGEVPEIEHRFDARRSKLKPLDFKPHYNFAPSMELPIVLPAKEGGETPERELVMGKWGFMPPWMKNFRPQANARLETVAEKRMFRSAFQKRHCLIPANSFFEWHTENGKKQPYLFRCKDNPLFAFAGIWEEPAEEGGLPTFSLITTEANSLMAKIHDRMPVILKKEDEEKWLHGWEEGKTINIETQYPAKQMEMFPVTPKMNKVSYTESDAIEPFEPPRTLGV